MSSDLCGCCWLNCCRVPSDDGESNWLCQECIDRCPPDGCVIPDVSGGSTPEPVSATDANAPSSGCSAACQGTWPAGPGEPQRPFHVRNCPNAGAS